MLPDILLVGTRDMPATNGAMMVGGKVGRSETATDGVMLVCQFTGEALGCMQDEVLMQTAQ